MPLPDWFAMTFYLQCLPFRMRLCTNSHFSTWQYACCEIYVQSTISMSTLAWRESTPLGGRAAREKLDPILRASRMIMERKCVEKDSDFALNNCRDGWRAKIATPLSASSVHILLASKSLLPTTFYLYERAESESTLQDTNVWVVPHVSPRVGLSV